MLLSDDRWSVQFEGFKMPMYQWFSGVKEKKWTLGQTALDLCLDQELKGFYFTYVGLAVCKSFCFLNDNDNDQDIQCNS